MMSTKPEELVHRAPITCSSLYERISHNPTDWMPRTGCICTPSLPGQNATLKNSCDAEKWKYTSGCDILSPVNIEHWTTRHCCISLISCMLCLNSTSICPILHQNASLPAESAKKNANKIHRPPSPNPNGKNMRMYGWSPCCLKKKVKTK